jgi:hypothetical protein
MKELKELQRDRSKQKNIKHGATTFDETINIA